MLKLRRQCLTHCVQASCNLLNNRNGRTNSTSTSPVKFDEVEMKFIETEEIALPFYVGNSVLVIAMLPAWSSDNKITLTCVRGIAK